MILVSSGVVAATLDTLRSCGGGRRECLVYWTAPLGGEEVCAIIHPRHLSSVVGVAVDGPWATSFFIDLVRTGTFAIAQVHTHPGASVQHSVTDDEHVLVSSAGYVSIVIPDFAAGSDRSGWGIWQMRSNGGWSSAPEVIRTISGDTYSYEEAQNWAILAVGLGLPDPGREVRRAWRRGSRGAIPNGQPD